MTSPEQEIIDLYQNELTNAKDIQEKLNKKYTLKKIKETIANIE